MGVSTYCVRCRYWNRNMLEAMRRPSSIVASNIISITMRMMLRRMGTIESRVCPPSSLTPSPFHKRMAGLSVSSSEYAFPTIVCVGVSGVLEQITATL